MSHVSLESLGIKDSVDNRISSVAVMQVAMVCGGMLCIIASGWKVAIHINSKVL